MNKKILLVSRLIVTIIIASIVSALVGLILMTIFSNIGMSDEDSVNNSGWISTALLGLMVGYKLNDLVRKSKT